MAFLLNTKDYLSRVRTITLSTNVNSVILLRFLISRATPIIINIWPCSETATIPQCSALSPPLLPWGESSWIPYNLPRGELSEPCRDWPTSSCSPFLLESNWDRTAVVAGDDWVAEPRQAVLVAPGCLWAGNFKRLLMLKHQESMKALGLFQHQKSFKFPSTHTWDHTLEQSPVWISCYYGGQRWLGKPVRNLGEQKKKSSSIPLPGKLPLWQLCGAPVRICVWGATYSTWLFVGLQALQSYRKNIHQKPWCSIQQLITFWIAMFTIFGYIQENI